jgi:hypothetical protein
MSEVGRYKVVDDGGNTILSESDEIVISRMAYANLTDGVSLTDLIGRAFTRALEDSIDISDDFSRKFTLKKNFTEGVTLEELIGKAVSLLISDGVTLEDLGIVRAIGKNPIENISVSDSITKGTTISFTDNIELAGVYARFFSWIIRRTYTFGATEWVTNEKISNFIDTAIWQLNYQDTGTLFYFDGTRWLALPAGTEGQQLKMGASGLPEWS